MSFGSLLESYGKSENLIAEHSAVDIFHNIIEDIELIPPVMQFLDAYEGKQFHNKLTLRNVGSKSVAVRIGIPTANIFKLAAMKQSYKLPPGLSISRVIRVKYSRTYAVRDSYIPIYINNKTIHYPLSITLNQAILIVDPLEVNFGQIDAVSSLLSKSVEVKNVGTKDCVFSIDLGRNELELIVDPIRGTVEAGSSLTLKLEMMGFHEGPFKKEFWIKSVPPKRVTVIGEFSTPKLMPTYPKSYADFSIIIFPRLYIGQTSTRTLMIKNLSSTDVMFCVKGIHEKAYVLYREAEELNPQFRNFHLHRLEGSLESQQTTVIEIKFEPKDFSESHAICFIQVIRVDFTDVDDSVVLRDNQALDLSDVDRFERRTSSVTNNMISSGQSRLDSEVGNGNLVDNTLVTEEKIAMNESFKVCLYGDIETVKVYMRPEHICLNEIVINDVYTREITFENGSNYLPIRINYLKAAFIDITPRVIFLKPKETREVLFRIKPKKPGAYTSKMLFELFVYEEYEFTAKMEKVVVGHIETKVSFMGILNTTHPKTKFNMKLSPTNVNEVGFMTHNIKFNTKIQKPKAAVIWEDPQVFGDDNSALIAFPNDRPQSLRPCNQQKPCKTIFAKIPRAVADHDEYSYPPAVICMKQEIRNYYNLYIRSKRSKTGGKQKKDSSYDIAKEWIMQRYICETIDVARPKPPITGFVPMSPIMLHNVKIRPRYIRLQRVAPISNVEHTFTVTNHNPFKIFIYVTSFKSGIYFPQGHCKIIEPNEEKYISFTCFAGLVGRYINLIQVIVNFCHLYSISVMVEVVPKMINLPQNVLTFELEKSGCIKYIELQNHLNSSICFSTDVSPSRFSITPTSGIILQKRNIICTIQYHNLPDQPEYCELILNSEGGGSQILQISRKKAKPKLEIYPARLILPNLPINLLTTHTFRINNKLTYDICFMIVDPSPLEGITVFPYEGVICGLDEKEFTVSIIIAHSVTFDTKIEFVFDDEFFMNVPVEGTVTLPLVDLKPDYIVNRQLNPFAYRRNIFHIKNESMCECAVRFDLDQYEFFRVTEKETDMDTTLHNTNQILLAGDVKTFYLHFNPMEALTESFYMPIIINDMIGPPMMSNVESTYFAIDDLPHSIKIKIPCMRVTSICSTTSLHFSTLKLSFQYGLSDVDNNKLSKFFTAKNVGNDAVEFCIRVDMLIPEFTLKYHSGTDVRETNCAIVSKLESGESTIFQANFVPTTQGKYENELPIYVLGYLDGCVFNFLRLIGTYEKPVMTTESKIYYMTPIPFSFKNVVMLDIAMKYHDKDCQVDFDAVHPDVAINLRDVAKRKSDVTKIRIVVMCLRSVDIFTEINFFCSCGASCSIRLSATCDNCYLTNYPFSEHNSDFIENSLHPVVRCFEQEEEFHTITDLTDDRNPNISTMEIRRFIDTSEFPENENLFNFPFFPHRNSSYVDIQYQERMRESLFYLERWIYCQGFYGTKHFKIPDTIALVPISKDKDNRNNRIEPPILTFLVELAGTKVRDASLKSKVNVVNAKNLALHFMTTYIKMVQFLRMQGATFGHLFPELLLTYEYYRIIWNYCPNLLTLKEHFDEEAFRDYSTRCYMDVILQSIKIFILKRIKMFDVSTFKSSSSDATSLEEQAQELSAHSFIEYEPQLLEPNNYIYTSSEHILLYWLQYHFDTQKDTLWKKHSVDDFVLPPKELKTFGKQMRDSLLLACVTAVYCPYVKSALADMYVPPVSPEQYHHNACILIRAWNLLKLSYYVEPNDIVHPNTLNLLLLTLYLYEILPSFLPSQTLTLRAKLTQESLANFSITNSSDHPITYSVIFFQNEAGSFRSEVDTFKILPKKVGVLQIKYQAKKIASQKAVLVLSGECPGSKYGKSRAINLDGHTNLNYSVKCVDIKCEMYKVEKMNIKLFSPYNVPDTFEIFYTIVPDRPTVDEDLVNLHSWKDYVLGKVPKRMYTKEYQFKITDPEEGLIFEPIVSTQLLPVRIYKMFMVGQYGDWCFDVRIVPRVSKKNHEVINVSLPRGFKSQPCVCREKSTEISKNCPRTIRVNIPSKNNLSHKSIREMFLASTDETYFAFWRKYLPIRVAANILRVLQWYNKASLKLLGFLDLTQKSQVYIIRCDEKSTFNTSPQITIEDTESDEFTEIVIHAHQDFNYKADNYIILENTLKLEKRFYKLDFHET